MQFVKEKLNSLSRICTRKFKLPGEQLAAAALGAFSPRERAIFWTLMAIMAGSTVGMLFHINRVFLVKVPAHGGTLLEGAIRSPILINPLFAGSERASEVDRDLTTLLYSGLLRRSSDGVLVPDLAERYEISPDGLTYTFYLKENIVWHDGKPITASDIVFTVERAQDPLLESPQRANWENVGVEELSERKIRFILKDPYTPFLENLTMGILPRHIWESIDPAQFEYNRYNREPIGSGPYAYVSMKRDKNDVPVSYELEAFDRFASGTPYIEKIRIQFYTNEDALLAALRAGEIRSTAYLSPEGAAALKDEGFRIKTNALRHVFGVFFNQNQETVFADAAVRRALRDSVDRERITSQVFRGFATPLSGPLPPGTLGYTSILSNAPDAPATSTPSFAEKIAAERTRLEQNGWKWSDTDGALVKKSGKETKKLSFAISTIAPSSIPALKAVAAILEENWKALGADVSIKVFETRGDLSQSAIRPRKYDALLFGEVIGRGSDPYAFWHSSQRLDPGLNIALYANIKADKLLEEGRIATTTERRAEINRDLAEIIAQDAPAIFLYAPHLMYAVPRELGGMTLGNVVTPSERFAGVADWYLTTTKVWKLFAKDRKRGEPEASRGNEGM